MRSITVSIIVLACLISTSFDFARSNQVENNNFNSDDTVSVEAIYDEPEATTVSYDENTTPLPELGSQRGKADENYCVTNSGLSGTCTSVKECFPRLFPVDVSDGDNDTPKHSGVYNQNLAKILIEVAGFCSPSGGKSSEPVQFSKVPTEMVICCASNDISRDFPLDNDTNLIDTDYTKKSCGHLKIDSKILPVHDKVVGGRKAVLGEFPWMVAMLRRGQQFCGASLLDNKNVLTAAHCVEFMTKKDVADLRLNLGDLDIYSTKDTKHVERRAKRVLYHKGFSGRNLAHDIAIIHLDKPVEFSKTIQPVCLHSGSPPYDTGKEEAAVTGWGTTSSGGSQSSDLLAVNINVITQEECTKRYSTASKKIGPGMVCAGSKGKDSCQGDSGGPLVIHPRTQGKQIGIVSWGIGCASYPGVYTRVDKYMKWISKNKLK